MKNMISIVLLICIHSTCHYLSAQVAVTIDLKSGSGQDLYISNFPGWEDLNLNPDPDFAAVAWTGGGIPFIGRSMAQFDLSVLPAGVAILDARLDLYANPTPEHSPGHSNTSGSNLATLRRIITPWSEETTTWNSQPTTTTQNQVMLPPTSITDADYLDVNVTGLVRDMYQDPANSFGFMLQLVTEAHFRALNFASSDGPDPSVHPKLRITYTADSCAVFTVNSGEGQDLYISNFPGWEDLNLNPDPDFAAVAWTGGGIPFIGRSLAYFDLSHIPQGAIITSASLDLFANPAPEHSPGHSIGSNTATLRRITSPWNENTTTWNTQPTTTTQNEVVLSASTGSQDDYLGIDVTALVQDMADQPSESHGFFLRLNTEQPFRALNFASGNTIDTEKVPRLEVCYTLTTSILSPAIQTPELVIFPNPASDQLSYKTSGDLGLVEVSIYDMHGRTLQRHAQMPDFGTVDISGLAVGIYTMHITAKGRTILNKFTVK